MPDGVPLREFIVSVIDEHEQRNKERIRALERQVADLERLLEARMRSMAVAVEKSEAQYDARFASANEFRQAMQDLSRTFATKDSVDDRVSEMGRRSGETDKKVGAIENRLAKMDGRALGYSMGVGAVVLIISIVAQLLSLGG